MSILLQEPYQPHAYETIKDGVLPSTVAPEIYESWCKKFTRIDDALTFRIMYESAGHQVSGVLMQPREATINKHPLIIFNRGGRGRYGMLNILTILNLLYPLIQKGYLVLASNYRGVDGGIGGEDEFGGAEVQDIPYLLEEGRKLPEWDNKNAYLFGWSRGGMMTLLALKQGADVSAAAIGAPLIDLTLSAEESHRREDWLQRVLPDYEAKGFRALEERSAPYWISALRNTPLLMLHGDADSDVSILHSRNLALKLAERHHPHRLIEYPGGNHYLNAQRAEVLNQIDSWFKDYGK